MQRRLRQPSQRSDIALPDWMSAKQEAVYRTLLDLYEARRYAERHTQDTIKGDRNIVLDFLTHAKRLPGEVQPEHFEAWSKHLYLDREVAAGTQRKYQGAVRTMFKFLCATPRCRNLVRSELGCDIVQVVTAENAIPHRRPNESGRTERRAMTKAEQDVFFQTLDEEIAHASRTGSKSLPALQRDKAMFHSMKCMGLRADECVGLNLPSFTPDSRFPEQGGFAMGRVFGKGSKWRSVPIDDPILPKVLSWYIEFVRPQYALKADEKDAQALFLSEQGYRISYSALYGRFKRILSLAGLPLDLVPHSLRHASVTDGAMEGLSLYANQLKHGHENASTTQTYMSLPDDFIVNEFARHLRKRMKQGKAEK